MIANYHTHTPLCHHACGTMEEYIQAALRSGFDVLGFSDHTPWAYATPGFVSRIRMLPEELDGYVGDLQQLRKKYAGQIKLHIGLEAEYFPAYMGWLQEQCERLGVEYLILGCHYDRTDETGMYFGRATKPEHLLRYSEQVVEGMESGAYRYLAHPDLFLNYYHTFDKTAERVCREICAAAAKQELPLEYNLLGQSMHSRAIGRLGYTTRAFWEIAAEYNVKAILGCDAHDPQQLDCMQAWADARAMLTGLNIPVLDTLPGLE